MEGESTELQAEVALAQADALDSAVESTSNNVFDSEHLQTNLKGRSVRAGMITLSAQGVKFVLNLASTMILARLLAPAEFGVVAMVSPITGFISLFKDLGLSLATVQREKISHEQVSTLFWVNVAMSVFLTIATAAISPLVGLFYHDSRTTWVTLASAATFIFGGLTAQHTALLTRHMKFGWLAGIDIATIVVSITVATVTAWWGWSYWSLVAMTVAGGFVNCIAVWIASPWRPGLPKRGAGTKSMLKFGGGMTIANLIAYLCTQIDRVFLGRFWGPESLGVYTRAISLFLTPMFQVLTPLNSVMFPLFSRLATDRVRLSNAACRIIELACAAVLPMALIAFIDAGELVRLVFGPNPQWELAVPVTRAFSVVAVTLPISLVVNTLFTATGRSDIIVKWETAWFFVLIIAIGIGVKWGALGVALAMGFGGLFTAPLHIYIGHRVVGLDLRQIGGLVAMNAVSAAACVGSCFLLKPAIAGLPLILRAGLNVMVILMLHGLALYFFGALGRIKHLLLERGGK